MGMNIKLKIDTCCIRSRKVLVFVSLILVAVLFFSCLFSIFSVSPFALGASNVVVSNEVELRDAVKNAVEPTVIALSRDIILASSALVISADKDVTLTSVGNSGFFKLFGSNGDTIVVERDGVLRLEGIVVTHTCGTFGRGVYVKFGGTLIMSCGEICDNTQDLNLVPDVNTPYPVGGGVFNCGSFSMSGGKISNNTATQGGGVYINGYDFTMSGGEISDNTAEGYGGGVFSNNGKFTLYAGVIYGNSAKQYGGVFNSGTLVVGIYHSTFTMSGGVIYGNTVIDGNGAKVVDSMDTLWRVGCVYVGDNCVSGVNDSGVLSDDISELDDTGKSVDSKGFGLRDTVIVVVVVMVIAVMGCWSYFAILRHRKN